MKRNYFFTLFLCFITVATFAAKQPVKGIYLTKERISRIKSQSVNTSASAETPKILLFDNFSKFVAGSETTPDATDITDAETGEIPASYTQNAGWYGWGVYQAGGTAYLGWVKYSEVDATLEDGPGYISTPVFDASNASNASTGYTIKFKARSKSITGDVMAVYWNWFDESLNDYDYDGNENITITNQWAEYTVEASFGNAESYVDFYATASEFYIDDVEISAIGGNTPPPSGNVVFYETFGDEGRAANPRAKVNEYTDYDNGSPVVFSYTTTDYPDVRATSTINTHVWFPANKETDMVISNINAKGYSNLKLSFDVACAAGNTNLNKMMLYVNDVAVTVPSVAIATLNTYVSSGDIAINAADAIKLRFYYTVANNPTNFGYRIDNVKITGDKVSGLENPRSSGIYVADGRLVVEGNTSDEIEIYQVSGVLAARYSANTQTISLGTLNKGIYLVKAGDKIQKIIL
ncbi:MAG: hypothetical protein VB102_12395 [Paludibacter sp.]|nr:hypothetical protein [Paludibacter sp.]